MCVGCGYCHISEGLYGMFASDHPFSALRGKGAVKSRHAHSAAVQFIMTERAGVDLFREEKAPGTRGNDFKVKEGLN